jgi:hypothetical protein
MGLLPLHICPNTMNEVLYVGDRVGPLTPPIMPYVLGDVDATANCRPPDAFSPCFPSRVTCHMTSTGGRARTARGHNHRPRLLRLRSLSFKQLITVGGGPITSQDPIPQRTRTGEQTVPILNSVHTVKGRSWSESPMVTIRLMQTRMAEAHWSRGECIPAAYIWNAHCDYTRAVL